MSSKITIEFANITAPLEVHYDTYPNAKTAFDALTVAFNSESHAIGYQFDGLRSSMSTDLMSVTIADLIIGMKVEED